MNNHQKNENPFTQHAKNALGLAEKEDRIKLVSFTGSAKVGWDLKAHSGRKRVLLELGGNNAVIVDETANLRKRGTRPGRSVI